MRVADAFIASSMFMLTTKADRMSSCNHRDDGTARLLRGTSHFHAHIQTRRTCL